MNLKVLGLPFSLALYIFVAPALASGVMRDIGAKKYAAYKAHMINFRRFEYLNSFAAIRNVDVYCSSANSAYRILTNYRQYLEEAVPDLDFESDKRQLLFAVKKC